jgi:lysophospholipase L1-like esterase
VAWRGFRRLAAAAAVGFLVLLVVTSAEAIVGPSIPRSLPPGATGTEGPAQGKGREAALLTGCEQQLQPDRRPSVPTVAIVGASFTAGVGAEDPAGSWAVLLARQLRWNAFVYGVPGAGYVHPGLGRKGPVAAEVARVHLGALRPSLIIVQAGHDDMSVPPDLERLRVEQTVAMIRAQAPGAWIALVTVFAGRKRQPALYAIDQAIVAGGRAADPQVIIMDPLAEGWRFPRARDGLHPSPLGDAWIAGKVAGILRQYGVRPAPAGRGAALCTITVPGAEPADQGTEPARAGSGAAFAEPPAWPGSQNRMSVPPPGPASARTVPLWRSATWRTMDSPRPEPGTPRADGAR